jgi:hypothetical protein
MEARGRGRERDTNTNKHSVRERKIKVNEEKSARIASRREVGLNFDQRQMVNDGTKNKID